MSGRGRPASTAVVPSGIGCGGWVDRGAGFVGTLLGPEGVDAFSGSGPSRFPDRSDVVRVWWGGWGGGWLLVENCTVDASIFLDVNVESESVARPCAPS